MDSKRLQTYLRLYWIRILVITGLTLLAVSLVFLIIASTNSWIRMESFYKEQMKANMGFQLYLYLVGSIFSGAIYVFLMYWMFYGGGAMRQFGKLQTKAIEGKNVGIRWNDVIGMEDVKREAWEAVTLIKERIRLQKAGGHIIKGILFVGPPGVGKTYLAKAMATECNLPFLSVVGSELEGIIVGLGAMKIRQLFKAARNAAEINGGCLIFIDEVDSVARPRRADMGLGGQQSYNMAVNQLLAEMDGLRQKEYNIVVIAATNVPEEELDPALMRSGRFDRKIYIGLPGLDDRAALLKYYLNQVSYDRQNLRVEHLARLTVGNSPADIANIIKESTLIAVRNRKAMVSMNEISEARERIALGIKRKASRNPREREAIAYHEAGHVVVTYLAVPFQDVLKASIIPRKGAAGVTWTPEKEEIQIHDKNHLLGIIKSGMGGYVAEKIKFGITSVGVGSDFEHATNTAFNMVWRYGMGKSGYIGDFRSSFFTRNHQLPSFAHELDKEANEIIKECLGETEELLRKNWDIVDEIAKQLVKEEELDYDEIEAIFKSFGKDSSKKTPEAAA